MINKWTLLTGAIIMVIVGEIKKDNNAINVGLGLMWIGLAVK
jgi:hypothetical protein